MGYAAGLLVSLVAFWLTMSGQMTVLHLSLGVVSIVLTLIVAYRLDILDAEASPYGRIFAFLRYWPWLLWEIAKTNVQVIRSCLSAELDISPALVKVRSTARSDLGRVTFANSITLTPGTVTVEIEGDRMLIHALHEESALPESFAEMDRRSTEAAEGKGQRA
jgi:multicomponent Na+:H+ antiporter subunit E